MNYLSQIHEYKGKQELFLRQKPVEMERLLQEQYGTDLKGAARETANCLI